MIGSLYGAPGIEWIAESLNLQGAYADGIVPQLKFFSDPIKTFFMKIDTQQGKSR